MTGEENLCMAGGVAFNSVMNGAHFSRNAVQEFLRAAGSRRRGLCSLARRMMIWHQKLNNPRKFVMNHSYWGPKFSNEECQKALDESGLKYETLPDEELLPQAGENDF